MLVPFGQSTNISCFELILCGVHQPFAFVYLLLWLSIAVKVLIPCSGTGEWEQVVLEPILPWMLLPVHEKESSHCTAYCQNGVTWPLVLTSSLPEVWEWRNCATEIPSATGESLSCGNCRYWCVYPLPDECFWGAGCDAFWCPAVLAAESPCMCLQLFSVKWPGKGNCCSRVVPWGWVLGDRLSLTVTDCCSICERVFNEWSSLLCRFAQSPHATS